MTTASAYIIAARRSAIGRVGGLHKSRRVEDLAAPVVAAALSDCGVKPREVDEVVVGNASEGGNPARLIALAAGLSESCAATTVDRQCGSGLEAILSGIRLVACGDAGIVVAGGAESISNAPWRIAKPRSVHMTPRFLGLGPDSSETADREAPHELEAAEALSRRLGFSRAEQDAWALKSHLKAAAARERRRFVGEIVPLRANPDEARDQSAVEPDLEDLEKLPPILPPDGTLTAGNTSTLHDGAAFVVIVSEAQWQRLGRPPALHLVASATQGVAPDRDGLAPIEAARKLFSRLADFDPASLGVVELSEASAAQALAIARELAIDTDLINPDGGAVVRGHPHGAAGAILPVRLFTRMVRSAEGKRPARGLALIGTRGGMGIAALFEAVAG